MFFLQGGGVRAPFSSCVLCCRCSKITPPTLPQVPPLTHSLTILALCPDFVLKRSNLTCWKSVFFTSQKQRNMIIYHRAASRCRLASVWGDFHRWIWDVITGVTVKIMTHLCGYSSMWLHLMKIMMTESCHWIVICDYLWKCLCRLESADSFIFMSHWWYDWLMDVWMDGSVLDLHTFVTLWIVANGSWSHHWFVFRKTSPLTLHLLSPLTPFNDLISLSSFIQENWPVSCLWIPV